MGHVLSAVLRWEADGSTLGHGLLFLGAQGRQPGMWCGRGGLMSCVTEKLEEQAF